MSGGEILLEVLLREGVRYVFGIPGDRWLPFLDAIYRYGEKRGLQFVMTRHEQAAAHMADAWARETGQPGVCLGVVGPGAADLVPGVYPAWADGIPMIVMTSQNQSWHIYPDRGFIQSLDQHSLFKPITKWSAVVSRTDRIAELVQRAFRKALSGRPGPVHLDFPGDVLYDEIVVDESTLMPPERYRPVRRPVGDPVLVKMAAKMLAEARLPLIHAGGGVLRSGASQELVELAEFLQAPVTPSVAGRGSIPEDHPLWIPPSSPPAIAVQNEADVVLIVGSKLADLDFWGRPPGWGDPAVQKTIQIDIDPDMIGLNRPVDIGIVGDAKATLRAILNELKRISPEGFKRDLSAYIEFKEQWEREYIEMAESPADPIHPLKVVKEVRDFFPRDAISVVDGGNTAVWAYYLNRIYTPDGFLWAADSGHLGTGLPYAIAAKLAHPERDVYLLTGDGAFMFNIQELETARRLKANIVAIVFNDGSWGMVKGTQKLMFKERYIGVDFTDVRYDQVARAMGCYGERVTSPDMIRPALERAVASGLPAVIDVIVDKNIHLVPPDLETLGVVWMEGLEPPEREIIEEEVEEVEAV